MDSIVYMVATLRGWDNKSRIQIIAPGLPTVGRWCPEALQYSLSPAPRLSAIVQTTYGDLE